MLRYEALMLVIPEVTQDETKALESQVEGVVKQGGGTALSFERWGKYRLAYPVKKNEYGVYFLARFQAEKPEAMLKELQTLLAVKFNDVVMRSMISALDSKQSLEYQRPHSLEEAPAKEATGFMREPRDRDHRDRDGGYAKPRREAESNFSEEQYDEEANA